MDAVPGESDEGNNCSPAVRVTVQATGAAPRGHPDLVVTSASVSDSGPAAGARFTLSATARNAGGGAAPATMLRYYRSADATITTSDTHVGTVAIAGLAAAGSASGSVDPDRAGDGAGHVLLRGVRGPGGGRVGHDQQLLGVR